MKRALFAIALCGVFAALTANTADAQLIYDNGPIDSLVNTIVYFKSARTPYWRPVIETMRKELEFGRPRMLAEAHVLVTCYVELGVEQFSTPGRAYTRLTAHGLTDIITFTTGKVDAGWAARNLD